MAGFDLVKNKIRRTYNLMVESYDLQYRKEQLDKYRVVSNFLTIGRYDSVLDAGCGTGLFLQSIAGSAFLTVGIDNSRKMLEIAKARCCTQKNLCLVCGDADHLPFQKKMFDEVFAFTLIQNVPDPNKTIQELIRVAKTNSKIVITAHKRIFTKHHFIRLLEKSGLDIKIIENNKSKDYIAICTSFTN